ncbi:MAG: RNA 2',3'-cyclic phosphodiesterase [candidate division Zixibacteria bacterium]|nr:RNA 2',3'-cyclic phosphodiesterase [candidate division Zixibacteria bacterium]
MPTVPYTSAVRAFIAINLPDPVRRELGEIIERIRNSGTPARWVPPENLHVTVKFLDEIRQDQVRPIIGAITLAVSQCHPFELRLGGFGCFPNERKARIFWTGIESGFDTLKSLAREIDHQVANLGFALETRPFSAHITLARLREPGPADRLSRAAAHVPYHSDPIPVTQIDLMRSVLSPGGAAYSVIDSVRLRELTGPDLSPTGS